MYLLKLLTYLFIYLLAFSDRTTVLPRIPRYFLHVTSRGAKLFELPNTGGNSAGSDRRASTGFIDCRRACCYCLPRAADRPSTTHWLTLFTLRHRYQHLPLRAPHSLWWRCSRKSDGPRIFFSETLG